MPLGAQEQRRSMLRMTMKTIVMEKKTDLELCACVEADVVVEQLDVAGHQLIVDAQLVGSCQLFEERDRLQLRGRQARHGRMPLTRGEVVAREIDGQEALLNRPDSVCKNVIYRILSS